MYNNNQRFREEVIVISQRRIRTPSFSSSLLDSIYRSIDLEEEKINIVEKQSTCSVSVLRREEDEMGISNEDVFMMEKRSTQSNYSSSSSDDSSSRRGSHGGLFSSSDDTESKISKNRAISEVNKNHKPKFENGFSKTKLKAKKIYGELKKVKQPISPGGKIANFLNLIFSSGSKKKVKICSIGSIDDVKAKPKSKSACSSVTSFSRSCLNKTPQKQSSNNGDEKRSVRFYPVSVIVDEDSRPCGHKCIYEDDPGLIMPMKIGKSSSLKEDVAKGAKKYIRNYQKKISEFDFRGFHSYEDEDDDDDDDDDKSCSSSDLFELDHLIGIGRYREELPVYETTNFKTNQAIANGFVL